jgi:8-hydroxy-5-deazaflavin:NADPH oxidoreductase
MRIACLGYGNVGGPLADQWQRAGHEVTLAASDHASERVVALLARNPALRVAPPAEAIARADVVVVAIPFKALQEALAPHERVLAGRIVIDCVNPVGPGLAHGLESKRSGSETIQAMLPGARVVKAFSIYGFETLEDHAFPEANVKPAMLFCGDDAEAKRLVGGLIAELGWEPVDVGGLVQALHLEHLTLLWIRMVRAGGRSPHLVWARLAR